MKTANLEFPISMNNIKKKEIRKLCYSPFIDGDQQQMTLIFLRLFDFSAGFTPIGKTFHDSFRINLGQNSCVQRQVDSSPRQARNRVIMHIFIFGF